MFYPQISMRLKKQSFNKPVNVFEKRHNVVGEIESSHNVTHKRAFQTTALLHYIRRLRQIQLYVLPTANTQIRNELKLTRNQGLSISIVTSVHIVTLCSRIPSSIFSLLAKELTSVLAKEDTFKFSCDGFVQKRS